MSRFNRHNYLMLKLLTFVVFVTTWLYIRDVLFLNITYLCSLTVRFEVHLKQLYLIRFHFGSPPFLNFMNKFCEVVCCDGWSWHDWRMLSQMIEWLGKVLKWFLFSERPTHQSFIIISNQRILWKYSTRQNGCFSCFFFFRSVKIDHRI